MPWTGLLRGLGVALSPPTRRDPSTLADMTAAVADPAVVRSSSGTATLSPSSTPPPSCLDDVMFDRVKAVLASVVARCAGTRRLTSRPHANRAPTRGEEAN